MERLSLDLSAEVTAFLPLWLLLIEMVALTWAFAEELASRWRQYGANRIVIVAHFVGMTLAGMVLALVFSRPPTWPTRAQSIMFVLGLVVVLAAVGVEGLWVIRTSQSRVGPQRQ